MSHWSDALISGVNDNHCLSPSITVSCDYDSCNCSIVLQRTQGLELRIWQWQSDSICCVTCLWLFTAYKILGSYITTRLERFQASASPPGYGSFLYIDCNCSLSNNHSYVFSSRCWFGVFYESVKVQDVKNSTIKKKQSFGFPYNRTCPY